MAIFSKSKHKANTTGLHPKGRQTCFKNIFKNNNKPNAQTLLCLEGIAADDLNNIMDYIYNGEVNIFQDCLDRFLSVAQRLKLEGHIGNEDTDQEVHDEAYSKEEKKVTEVPFVHDAKYKTHTNHIAVGRELENFDKIQVAISSAADVNAVKERLQQCIERDADGNIKCKRKEGIGKNPGTARCNLEKHIETHLEGLSFPIPCQLCGKMFRSTNGFNTHKSRFHR